VTRIFDSQSFKQTYDSAVVHGHFQEEPAYYPRYRFRYETLLREYCARLEAHPTDVLEVGGGQLALLARLLWKDRAVVADLPGPHHDYLHSHGVETVVWNITGEEDLTQQRFDAIFFSEVIEHLPIPGHRALERLRTLLKPGGWIICSTPNLYRIRNIVYLAAGKRIFDHFRQPTDSGLGHVLEYSRDHLEWQFREAGFEHIEIDLRQLHHFPKNPLIRVMSWLGSPLMLMPRFRDNLVAVARAPSS